MGSCMSCKAGKEAYAYTTTPAFHACPHYKSIGNRGFMACTKNESKPLVKRNVPYTRGQATLFGFKRRPATAPSSTTAPILDNATAPAAALMTHTLCNRPPCDEPLEDLRDLSPISSSKSTPRIPRPKKDVDGNNSVRTNRFGFRSSTPLAITNKVGDCNFNVLPPSSHIVSHQHVENQNATGADKPRAKGGGKLPLPKSGIPAPESAIDTQKNKNKPIAAKPDVYNDAIQATRFTLQTTHLPKLQYPVRLSSAEVDVRNTSKIAKTAANNSTRRGVQSFGEESSSKDGSEDSGIGSHQSTGVGNAETDTLHGVEILDSSPMYGYRRNRNMQKPRTLEMVVNGQSFDLRDLKDEDASDPTVITEISVIPIQSSTPRISRTVPTATGIARGIVQERSRMYRQQMTGNSQGNVRQGSRMSHPVFDSNNPLRIDEDSCSERSSDSGRSPRVDSEEKVYRDSSNSEKSLLGKGLITPSTMEGEDWGHGEAMAEEISSSSDDGGHHLSFSLSSTTSLKAPVPVAAPSAERNPRPVILRIEDPRFAAFAAAASANMIEDEKSPVDSLISSPPSSSADELSEGDQQKSLVADEGKKAESGSAPEDSNARRSSNTLSPESPGTPTNASNSLSLSEGRDFLIDDEIADQPGLTFDDGLGTVSRDLVTSSGGCSSLHLSENVTLVDSPPKSAGVGPTATTDSSPSPARSHRINRTGSVDTLSPCESIASDDLMLDFERSERSEFDCTAGDSHLDGSLPGGLLALDESSADASDDPVKEWSVTASSLIKEAGLVTGRSRLLRPRAGSGAGGGGSGGGGGGGGSGGGGGGSVGSGSSAPDSPRSSLDSRPRGSPLRPHQPRSQTNSSDCDDGGLYLDRHTYHSICQDIVNHKTMLLKLMRHLQKDQENRAETLNPFDSSLKNGLFYNLASTDVPSGEPEDGRTSSIVEEVADLRRQVVFLQQQLEEKERTIQLLQIQMVKYSGADGNKEAAAKETCNAATQTDRVRPVSAGPSLLQSLPSDNNGRPLVSSNDPWSQQRHSVGGSNPALAKPPSRLPSARMWKPRSNPAPAEPHGEPLQTTSRKSQGVTLGTSGLPQKLAPAAAAGSLPQPVNSVDKRTLIAK